MTFDGLVTAITNQDPPVMSVNPRSIIRTHFDKAPTVMRTNGCPVQPLPSLNPKIRDAAALATTDLDQELGLR